MSDPATPAAAEAAPPAPEPVYTVHGIAPLLQVQIQVDGKDVFWTVALGKWTHADAIAEAKGEYEQVLAHQHVDGSVTGEVVEALAHLTGQVEAIAPKVAQMVKDAVAAVTQELTAKVASLQSELAAMKALQTVKDTATLVESGQAGGAAEKAADPPAGA